MNALQGVWIASVVGACLFWLAGFLWARGRTGAAGKPKQSEREELEQVSRRLDHTTEELEQNKEQLRGTGRQLEEARQQLEEARQQLSERTRLTEAARTGQDLQSREAEALKQRLNDTIAERARFEQEVESLENQLKSFGSEQRRLAHENAELNTRLKALGDEMEKKQNRADAAIRALETVKKRQATGDINLREVLQKSEEERQALQEQVVRLEGAQAEAQAGMGRLHVELQQVSSQLNDARSEMVLKSKRLVMLEKELKRTKPGMGGAPSTTADARGQLGAELSRRQMAQLAEQAHKLEFELEKAQKREQDLLNEVNRLGGLERVVSALKARLVELEHR